LPYVVGRALGDTPEECAANAKGMASGKLLFDAAEALGRAIYLMENVVDLHHMKSNTEHEEIEGQVRKTLTAIYRSLGCEAPSEGGEPGYATLGVEE
jgi:hypothetical protein